MDGRRKAEGRSVKITKQRWDESVRLYHLESSDGTCIDVGVYRDLDSRRYGVPTINCSATGSMKQAKAYRYLEMVRKALQLADQLNRDFTGK